MSGDSAARDVANASYQRCCDQPGFFESFYQQFFTVCPEAAPRFAQTDFTRQNRLLRHAFGILLVFATQPDAEPTVLSRIAERHSRRDLDVPPSLYPVFVDSMIATVRQYDPDFTPDVETAWRRTVQRGVTYMISRY